jgi:hypothetical protein
MVPQEDDDDSQDVEELVSAARDAKAEVEEAFEDDDEDVIIEAAREFFRLVEAIEDDGNASDKDLHSLQTAAAAFRSELSSRDISLDEED